MCDCEHEHCHPRGDCKGARTHKFSAYGMRQLLCTTCRDRMRELHTVVIVSGVDTLISPRD